MSALSVALMIFAISTGAALAGMILHSKLPDHHLDADSKDVIKLVMGLIATMAALVLGLLIASAQSSYNAQANSLEKLSADIVQLDHLLALYGPDSEEARDLLREGTAIALERIWSPDGVHTRNLDPSKMRLEADRFFDALQVLAPKTAGQRFVHAQALQLSMEIGQTRALMFQQSANSVSWPFLGTLVFWLAALFFGFGLFARKHATLLAAMLIGSGSVAAAVFLILELGSPYTGLIRLSDEPLRGALAQLEQVKQ